MDKRLERIGIVIEDLKNQMFGEKVDITEVATADGIRCKKVPYGHRDELLSDCSKWDKFEAGGLWGEPDGHELFRVTVEVPERFRGKEVFFFMSTGADDIWNTDNPQMLVYINGVRRSGMDMNHNCVSIYTPSDWEKETDRTVDIAIYAYSNLSENGNYLKMELAACDEAAKVAYFDMCVPFDGGRAMLGQDSRKNAIDLLSDKKAVSSAKPVDAENAEIILNVLDAACDIHEASEISSYLAENLYGKYDTGLTVASTGHTHIDVAWKWPVRQTREKVIRSYSTVMELMKRYPEYLFMASTPQMYEFVREDEPELFEEILERVKEGRFEPEGAMWLEADCNLTSGESLVRQILYGKRYFKETFGVDSDILWLPDVFGYSGAMPQILKKSGIRAFVTTKLAWNDTNRLPHDLFMWQGIDGTRIPTYLITTCDLPKADEVMREGGILNYTYNGRQDASQIMGTWRAFREKDITKETLTVYGFGDGGGGPTWEMLEMDRRLRRGIPGCPKTVQKSVSGFMDELLEKISGNSDVPVWDDELYLEFHRGTYTSMGMNKRYNRKLEILMQEAEAIRTYAFINYGLPYPRKELLDAWKIIMLNQFHDILPGSSIEEVYKVSEEDYKKAIDIVKDIIDTGAKAIANSGSWEHIVGISSCVVNSSADGIRIETEVYKISFDKNGEIVSLYDKEAGRELRDMSQVPLNRLIAFKDTPQEYDAWNIDADFADVSWDITDLKELSVCGYDEKGKLLYEGDGKLKKVCVNIVRGFRNSQIKQSIIISCDSRRIDFRTTTDWHEHQVLLKAAFPVDIDAKEITAEIQLGNIKRKLKKENSWDKAKFECCMHRWIDISADDGSYGCAVLNDSKYGYDSDPKLMRITLIKSGIFPNPNADQGLHEFTYSLLPHKGDYREGRVIEEAQKLNLREHMYNPETVLDIFNSIIDVCSSGVYVSAIKMAEDSDDIIIRLYEGHGLEKDVEVSILKDLSLPEGKQIKIRECDLLENVIRDDEDIEAETHKLSGERKLSMHFKAFEIKSLIVSVI
ncbi:alpha-mannosidase [Butyrivibrio sp. VCB2006]|uniref:alpha-mannosidase n=1 Tax=Butyrivibrio sp. VCB2006 TaxID=1280679 RepID=UPI0003F67358|nr:glycoside hydrolase family 38 C-terminal domain-containing protein [Butyrivibrio sp. VCB2006]